MARSYKKGLIMKNKLITLYVKSISKTIELYMKYKKVSISSGFLIKGLPLIKNKGSFIIHSNVKINSKYFVNPIGGNTFCSFIVDKNAQLSINEGTRISNSTFFCKEKITIGKNVFIGGDTRIYDTDFHSLNLSERIKEIDNDIRTKPILIDDGVFIGASSIILKGVSIGKNSIIGAGSVVTKSIPDNQIWAGNPAKYIKDIEND